jgi:hypothetical protein
LLDLPPRWGNCRAGERERLEALLGEYQGWTRAYQAQERQRFALAAGART